MKDGRLELARASPRKHMKRMFLSIFTNNSARWWWMMMTRSHDSQWQLNLWSSFDDDDDDDEDDDDSQWQLNLWSSFDGSANARLGSRWKEAAIRIPTRCCHNSRNPQMWIRIVDYIWSELWIIFITILYNILLEF